MPKTTAIREAQIALAEKAAAHKKSAQPLYDLAALFMAQDEDIGSVAGLCQKAYRLDQALSPMRMVLEAGGVKPSRVVERARALIGQGFVTSPLLASYLLAATKADNREVVAQLMDYERFFRVVPLHSGVASDLEALAQEMQRGSRYVDHPKGDAAIRQARRYDAVTETGAAPVVARLLSKIRHAAQDYIQSLPEDLTNPYLAAKPKDFSLDGWGIVSGPEGHHVSHIHHRSWASMVYYVSVPAIADDEAQRVGWLRIGAPPSLADAATRNGWPERWIKPHPDSLVIMPSYFYHDTRPVGVNQERVCIPVDIISSTPVFVSG